MTADFSSFVSSSRPLGVCSQSNVTTSEVCCGISRISIYVTNTLVAKLLTSALPPVSIVPFSDAG